MEAQTTKDVVSLRRLARRLGVPARWLREQAERGTVPCLRAGSQLLFSEPAVRAALAERAAGAQRKERENGEGKSNSQ